MDPLLGLCPDLVRLPGCRMAARWPHQARQFTCTKSVLISAVHSSTLSTFADESMPCRLDLALQFCLSKCRCDRRVVRCLTPGNGPSGQLAAALWVNFCLEQPPSLAFRTTQSSICPFCDAIRIDKSELRIDKSELPFRFSVAAPPSCLPWISSGAPRNFACGIGRL